MTIQSCTTSGYKTGGNATCIVWRTSPSHTLLTGLSRFCSGMCPEPVQFHPQPSSVWVSRFRPHWTGLSIRTFAGFGFSLWDSCWVTAGHHWAPSGACGEEPACRCGRHWGFSFNPWVGKIPSRKARQPTPGEYPRTEEPGRIQSMGSQSIENDWSDWVRTHVGSHAKHAANTGENKRKHFLKEYRLIDSGYYWASVPRQNWNHWSSQHMPFSVWNILSY